MIPLLEEDIVVLLLLTNQDLCSRKVTKVTHKHAAPQELAAGSK
jgi:hypothetical protein